MLAGLSHKFTLKDGRLQFTTNTQKATDDLHFFLGFIGWFRVYSEDFPPDVLWLIQKPVSLLTSVKTLLIGRLLNAVRKYLPVIQVNSCNFTNNQERKVWVLGIEFAYVREPEEVVQSVTFIGA